MGAVSKKDVFTIGVLVSLSGVFLGYLTHNVFAGNIKLYPKNMSTRLPDLISKLELVLKYQVFPLTWLLVNVFIVAISRGFYNVNPLVQSGEQKMQGAKNVLQNSMEQYILSFGAQLLLVTHLEAGLVLKAIPLMNVLFFVGRVTFWLGYPMKRSFGFPLTMLPSVAAICYSIYKTVILLNLIKV